MCEQLGAWGAPSEWEQKSPLQKAIHCRGLNLNWGHVDVVVEGSQGSGASLQSSG